MERSTSNPSGFLIRRGRVIDPARKLDQVQDIGILDGRIMEPEKLPKQVEVIEAEGLVVTPGLIDMHVHLREPGREDEETIQSGARAAVWGGFTTIVAMPNTEPAIDDVAGVEFVVRKGIQAGMARVLTTAAISRGRNGETLTEMADLARAGAVGFSDDGDTVADSHLMRRALEYARITGRPIIDHAEDPYLSVGGVMNEGFVSTRLGLAGLPAEAEEVIISRNIMLARLANGRLHETHISTARSLEMIRQAKSEGLNVTCDCTPHHLFLTEDAVASYDADFKMKPPLRPREDTEALAEGLIDGSIDAIASDHAPHSMEEKDVEFDDAPFGVIGLETTLSLVLTKLVLPGKLSYLDMARLFTVGPSRVLGLATPNLSPGAEADVTIINPHVSWTVRPEEMHSRSRNTPFKGQTLTGRAWHVWVGGRWLLRDGRLAASGDAENG